MKGLKVIHEKGMCHNDVAFRNILQKFNVDKGRYEYSITDFSALKSGKPYQDLIDTSLVILRLWLLCVGQRATLAAREQLI